MVQASTNPAAREKTTWLRQTDGKASTTRISRGIFLLAKRAAARQGIVQRRRFEPVCDRHLGDAHGGPLALDREREHDGAPKCS
jgi:hypothetical protein